MLNALRAGHSKSPFPKARNLVADLLYEARRKPSIHVIFSADITDFMASRDKAGADACSVTAYVLACLARAVRDQPEMHAYRTAFGSHLITFDEVDVASTVEKTVNGTMIAWGLIIRDAGRKSINEIDSALNHAKTSPADEAPGWRFEHWLMRQPRFIRRLIWLGPRFSPFLKKHFLGTVAVTSIGMFSKGELNLLPLASSPLTLTLAIGGIEQQTAINGEGTASRSFISLCLCADHEIIDGAPLTRFAEVLRAKIADPEALTER
ncbi:MAG: 2-oxo acid dehydrogenase subunit E2 [Pikeienuella sp.]